MHDKRVYGDGDWGGGEEESACCERGTREGSVASVLTVVKGSDPCELSRRALLVATLEVNENLRSDLSEHSAVLCLATWLDELPSLLRRCCPSVRLAA